MSIRTVLAGIATALLAVAPGAEAALRPVSVGTTSASPYPFAVDGARAAWQEPQDGPIVLDGAASGIQRVVIRQGCRLLDLRETLALVRCDSQFPSLQAPYILAFPDPQLRAVPGADPSTLFTFIGREWLAGEELATNAKGGGFGPLVYLNWHTGARVEMAQGSRERDLDSPQLRAAPRPAHRPPYVTPVGRYGRGAGLSLVYVPVRGHRRVISRCRDYCMQLTSTSGLLTWLERGRIRAFDVRRGRFRAIAVPSGQILSVTHTSRRIYFTMAADADRATVMSVTWRAAPSG